MSNRFLSIVIAPLMGVAAIVAFAFLTSGWAAVALFFAMFANNISQLKD